MRRFRLLPIIAAALLVSTLGVGVEVGEAGSPAGSASAPKTAIAAVKVAADPDLSFARDVKPILDGRCVVCHSCYNAPCQLTLSSYDGATRGATKVSVYKGDRRKAVPPTRQFVDAKTPAGWRDKGFFPVLPVGGESAVGQHVMLGMLELGRSSPVPADVAVPDEVDLDISRKMTCPTSAEMPDYAKDHPHGGMPYATAGLSDEEYRTLVGWLEAGARGPGDPPPLSKSATAAVQRWEQFLNGNSNKHKLTARYLYEHLFLAHLYFKGGAPGEYFRMVRSSTPSGQPIDEIATVRPYDDPGVDPFYYRLWPIRSTLVYKTHMVYALSDAKMARYEELFLKPAWISEELPSYDEKDSANPFVTFENIPARTRYQFLLDNAHYFIMTFIRGPVCRGQIALDVINDHFYAVFLDPDADLSVTDPQFLPKAQEWLKLPAENESRYRLGGLWLKYFVDRQKYVKFREEAYAAADPDKKGASLDDIWHGDGNNDNALLTISRHFDSASVVTGFVGGSPDTVWVVDYPILERIYYDLVAGFNVFGNVVHQLSTRLYMDYLRMESEDLFLSFLPPASREPLRDSWYEGAHAQLKVFVEDRLPSEDIGTQVVFATDDVKNEMVQAILATFPEAVKGEPDRINRCAGSDCARRGATAAERRVENALRPLAGVRASWIRWTPHVTFLRVDTGSGGKGLAYTLIHNEAHSNVAFMFGEEDRRRPQDDTLTIVRSYIGNYPNFFFDVKIGEINDFVDQLAAVRDADGFTKLVDRFGVRRTSAAFWAASDWFNEDFTRTRPIEAGLFDLNRYANY